MNENGSNDIRDDLPRVSVDSFQDLARIKDSLNDVAIAALDAKLAERGMSHHREAFLQHMHQACSISSPARRNSSDSIQFVTLSLSKANSNLRINGRNFDEYDEGEQGEQQKIFTTPSYS